MFLHINEFDLNSEIESRRKMRDDIRARLVMLKFTNKCFPGFISTSDGPYFSLSRTDTRLEQFLRQGFQIVPWNHVFGPSREKLQDDQIKEDVSPKMLKGLIHKLEKKKKKSTNFDYLLESTGGYGRYRKESQEKLKHVIRYQKESQEKLKHLIGSTGDDISSGFVGASRRKLEEKHKDNSGSTKEKALSRYIGGSDADVASTSSQVVDMFAAYTNLSDPDIKLARKASDEQINAADSQGLKCILQLTEDGAVPIDTVEYRRSCIVDANSETGSTENLVRVSRRNNKYRCLCSPTSLSVMLPYVAEALTVMHGLLTCARLGYETLQEVSNCVKIFKEMRFGLEL